MTQPSSSQERWYIVQCASGKCDILPANAVETQDTKTWGPFETKNQAIAKRVGLIRAGKCQPS